MQRSTIIAMLKKHHVGRADSLHDIEMLRAKYPYAHALQVLYAIGLKEEDHLQQKEQLNLAAIYTADRSKLYEYIVKSKLESAIASAEAEVQEETPPHREVAVADAENEIAHLPNEPEAPMADVSKFDEPALPTEPLEEEIMRAAILHLGEMETGRRLDELAATVDAGATPSTLVDNDNIDSFGSWLLSLEHKKEEKESPKQVEKKIIEKFIQESPQISPVKTAFFSPSQMGKMSLVEDESFVTETLARIYEKQGDFKKAARAYQNLALKYPEKRLYFAALQKQAEEKNKG